MLSKTVLLLSVAAGTLAQRPSDTPICDYYTTALLEENTAKNQYTLLTLVVNTVVIGNYTEPNVGIAVPGILAPGTQGGEEINLLQYFDGSLQSSNRGDENGVSVNFLDDGGADPLKENKPANTEDSNQFQLLTHLYQFFGKLLGCSQYGMGDFPAYEGFPSMSAVHRFMNLNKNEVDYFIMQVGLAAASFGVAEEDVTAVGEALNTLFNYRCSPPTTVIEEQGDQLQSICLAEECPLDPKATCAAYPMVSEAPSATGGMGGGNMTSMAPTPTGSEPPMQSDNGAASFAGVGAAAAAIGAVAAVIAAL